MAAIGVGARDNPPALAEDLDDLFDYDVPMDILQNVDADKEVPDRLAKSAVGRAAKPRAEGLGIDEEIKVTKKRAPVARLDDTRLLSQAGIPKLRKIANAQLKFKGKGHEYSDVARLLNFYQLWLDDLYPRAKFVDGLAIIEKLGHTNRMQTMRKEWIDEGKPKNDNHGHESTLDVPEHKDISIRPVQSLVSDDEHGSHNGNSEPAKTPPRIKQRSSEEVTADSLFISDNEGGCDPPSEDDQYAFLARDEPGAVSKQNSFQRPLESSRKEDNNFEDEIEAMAGLDDMW